MSDRRYRFCFVTHDGKRSGYWQVEINASTRDIYLQRERPGRVAHVSLHASGQWHLKTLRPRSGNFEWTEPAPVAPGVTRVVEVIVSPRLARHDLSVPASADALALPEVGLFPHVNVVLVSRGADIATWLANGPPVATLATLPLVDGSTCHVLRHDSEVDDLPPIPAMPAPPPNEREAMLAMPNPSMWLVLDRADGTVVFLDAPVEFTASP